MVYKSYLDQLQFVIEPNLINFTFSRNYGRIVTETLFLRNCDVIEKYEGKFVIVKSCNWSNSAIYIFVWKGLKLILSQLKKILRRWLPENFVSYCGTKDGVVHFL